MKQFLIGFFTSILLYTAMWLAVIYFQSNNPTVTSQWINEAYAKKYAIAKGMEVNKIVVMAGSNALFGIDSKILSKAFGLPVVNYGVNAGLELPYTLHIVKKAINTGDILIVPLEYPMYSYDGTPSVQMIDYIISRDASYFWQLSLKEQLYMLWFIDIERVYKGYLYKKGESIDQALYGVVNIDEHGDKTQTSLAFRKSWMFDTVINTHVNNPEKYGADFNREAIGWQYLDTFMQWCEEREVKVVFVPSTLMKHETYWSDDEERWFYENIAAEVRIKGWTFVGNPYDYMYEQGSYFDTNFHLIDTERQRRTEQLINDLQMNEPGFARRFRVLSPDQ